MSLRRTGRGALALALVMAWTAPASATDGHFLHGVGAVNSAMGGAGVASMNDLLGSFYLNPAGIYTESGSRVALGFEMFKPQRSVASDFMGFAGETESKSEFVPIPAFGWSTALNEDVTLGVGLLGIGGFGVDYAQDNTNPILGPRPNGFGQVYSNFQLMKVSPALSYRASDKLFLGVAFNLNWASLAVDPMPVAAPTFDTQSGTAFYSRATAADGTFGWGAQAGLIYMVSNELNVGLSYSSPQTFSSFSYNAMFENPNLANFGQDRLITFRLDAPAIYGGGFSYGSGPLQVNGDARYIAYSSTEGFEESGIDMTGTVAGFGWEDIFVLAGGVQFQATPMVALRGGYNFTENPIPDEQSAFNVPAPAIVQHHLTLGVGLNLGQLGVDVGYYRAFENEITGQFMTPMGPMDVTNRLLEDSFLLSFSFNPEG